MYNIVFVVLHYETLDDTEKCINSLLKYLSYKNVQVVVVDNGSTNGKLERLEANYKENKQMHFVCSENNLGFARGNNIGFSFAKKELNADIIILANNDLVFEQEDFIDKLVKAYELEKFDVAGPQIRSLVDKKNQNPVPVLYHNVSEVKKRILKYYILFLLSIFNLDVAVQRKVAQPIEEYKPNEKDDFQLHGACMFFANQYIQKYDGLCDKTFMYCEESILKCMVDRDNMCMKYYDEIKVWHKEGSSTSATCGSSVKKRRFFYKNSIASCRVLEELMKSE